MDGTTTVTWPSPILEPQLIFSCRFFWHNPESKHPRRREIRKYASHGRPQFWDVHSLGRSLWKVCRGGEGLGTCRTKSVNPWWAFQTVVHWTIVPELIFAARSHHVSFSDFPLFPIIRRKSASLFMDLISKLSVSFLDDCLDKTLEELPTRDMVVKVIGTKKNGKPKRQLIGGVGDVIVHWY